MRVPVPPCFGLYRFFFSKPTHTVEEFGMRTRDYPVELVKIGLLVLLFMRCCVPAAQVILIACECAWRLSPVSLGYLSFANAYMYCIYISIYGTFIHAAFVRMGNDQAIRYYIKIMCTAFFVCWCRSFSRHVCVYAKRIRFGPFQCYENLQLNRKNLINVKWKGCVRSLTRSRLDECVRVGGAFWRHTQEKKKRTNSARFVPLFFYFVFVHFNCSPIQIICFYRRICITVWIVCARLWWWRRRHQHGNVP